MIRSRIVAVLTAVALGTLTSGAEAGLQLKYVVIVSRHGVRSPTWEAARLNQYSAEPWPDWGVPPGNLTPRGRKLIEFTGAYYRQWLSGEHLFHGKGCQDAGRITIRADREQRTLETGRALAEALLPGCSIAVYSQPGGEADPLFSGAGAADLERSAQAVRDRLGADPQKLLADHRTALDALRYILWGGLIAPKKVTVPPNEIGVSVKGKSVELDGPFANGSTFSEDLLLEYANGMRGPALGWGRLTPENLNRVLELHAVYTDLMRRTPYIARARGSNLLAHVLRSMEQAVDGKPVAGALGQPGDVLLVLSGHDTNQSNLSGMLGLSWSLPGYQPDDTPPGGALVFTLWRDPDTGGYFVKLQYVAQTLDQMRNAEPLSISAPPESQSLPIPGCEAARTWGGCPWEAARLAMQRAIDPEFTSIEPNPLALGARQ